MNPRPRSELVARELLCSLVRLLVGAVPANGVSTTTAQAIFFANHSSHLDTVVLLAALPLRWRMRVRPVAAMDYWGNGRIRRWIAERVLNVVFINRHGKVGEDALAPVRQALQEGASLIFFPEGTRHNGALPDEFKSGIFRLAEEFPRIALVPTYLENPNRTLPKGSLLVLPLINRVHFGAALSRIAEESKPAFLTRARQAVCELAPHQFSSSPK
ncbi:lysophospholipid acyltransferase family protein [Uliginosibacterium sp. sgz301328]|uniref:lysophospholipid acyltransferase family protein n=1 Tax=Uliginosibacterium sp. sgz301328 TaxID=3243764 RepID=UPI00359E88AD